MKRGYTLIETIAVFLLIAVMMLSASVALVPMSDGFSQAIQNSDAAQKAQLAFMRLASELTTISNVAASSAQSLTYDFLDPTGVSVHRTLSWSGLPGDALLLDQVPLTDDVADFGLGYASAPGAPTQPVWFSGARLISIRLETLQAAAVYSNHIAPRNLSSGGG